MKITEYDATSGETTVRDLTADEQAQRDADVAAAEAEAAQPVSPSLQEQIDALQARLDKAAAAPVSGDAAILRDNLKDTQ